MTIPPWLQPTDVLGSISRGAAAGTALRGQDIAEAEAADRLRATYDALAAHQAQAAASLEAHREEAANKLRAAMVQDAAMQQFRQQQEQRHTAAAEEGKRRFELQQGLREQRFARESEPVDWTEALPIQDAEGNTLANSVPISRNQRRVLPVTTQKEGTVSAADRLRLKALDDERKDILGSTSAIPIKMGLPPDQWPKQLRQPASEAWQRLQDIDLQKNDLLNGGATPQNPAAALRQPAARPSLIAPTPSPFKEGAIIRSKKDGKRYRVTGGVPVPIEDNEEE